MFIKLLRQNVLIKRFRFISTINYDSNKIVRGSTKFEKVVKSSAYVDKSMFIKDFIESTDDVSLITAPAGFCKSTNLDMLKSFLEIKYDEYGQLIDQESTEIYKIFSDTNPYNLALVENEKEFTRNHFGKYPILQFDFSNVYGDNNDEILDGIRTALCKAFLQHNYLFKCGSLDSYEKNLMNKYIAEYEQLNINDIKNGLYFLSYFLGTHFGEKVLVFIDGYDSPIDKSIKSKNLKVGEMIKLIDSMLYVCMYDNENVEKGLITGVSSILRASASSVFNNVSEYKFLHNHKFTKYYGFTQHEVEELFERFGVKKEERENVKKWYNGYIAQTENENEFLNIYNAWSVISFLKNKQFESYWMNNEPIGNIMNMLEVDFIRNELKKLNFLTNELEFKMLKDLSIKNLEDLQNFLIHPNKDIPDHYFKQLFFTYFFELGCLTWCEKENVFKYPNQDIKSEVAKSVLEHFLQSLKL
jgi:hypothetical protein